MAVKSITINLMIGGIQNPDNSIGDTTQYPHNLTYSYSMTNSQPTTNAPVVQSDGDIDLSLLPGGPGFTPEADIYFTVSGQIRGTDGNMYLPRWAQPGEGSGDPRMQGFCWLVTSPTDPTVVPWPPGMQSRLVPPGKNPGGTQTVLIDDNRRGSPYYYALGVCFDNVPGANGSYYFLTFDPKIVNPG